jgi:hypothetical protein
MTTRDGFPRDMEPLALDAATADGLVTGVVDADDAPPEYRGVARTLQALRETPESLERAGELAAVERIAAAVVQEPRARPRRHTGLSSRAGRVAAAVAVAGGVFLTGGLASAGSLPQPAQHVASAVLGEVGVSVPTGDENPAVVDVPPSATPNSAPAGTSISGQPSPGGPEPDVAATPPGLPSATAPGKGQGDVHGTKTHGTPPRTANGPGNGNTPNGAPPAGNGNGYGR